MKVRATNKFTDENIRPTELDYVPKIGELFELSEERAKELLAKGYIAIDNAIIENTKKEVKEVKKAVKKIAKK